MVIIVLSFYKLFRGTTYHSIYFSNGKQTNCHIAHVITMQCNLLVCMEEKYMLKALYHARPCIITQGNMVNISHKS